MQIENKTKAEIDEKIRLHQTKTNPLKRLSTNIHKMLDHGPPRFLNIKNKKLLNTLMSALYCKMVFLAWRKFAKKQNSEGSSKKKSLKKISRHSKMKM